MGNWKIIVGGCGPHGNSGKLAGNDADAALDRFVNDLRKHGHSIKMAVFSSDTGPVRDYAPSGSGRRRFFVDGNEYHVPSQLWKVTGAAIKQLAGKDPSYQLYRENMPQERDTAISDADVVVIPTDTPPRYYCVPPAVGA